MNSRQLGREKRLTYLFLPLPRATRGQCVVHSQEYVNGATTDRLDSGHELCASCRESCQVRDQSPGRDSGVGDIPASCRKATLEVGWPLLVEGEEETAKGCSSGAKTEGEDCRGKADDKLPCH